VILVMVFLEADKDRDTNSNREMAIGKRGLNEREGYSVHLVRFVDD